MPRATQKWTGLCAEWSWLQQAKALCLGSGALHGLPGDGQWQGCPLPGEAITITKDDGTSLEGLASCFYSVSSGHLSLSRLYSSSVVARVGTRKE